VLTVDARFVNLDSGLPTEFTEAYFLLTVGEHQFQAGPDTRNTVEIELECFIRSRRARHWGSFYGIEDEDEAILHRVVYEPGVKVRTAEALSAYSMVPRLIESSPPLVVVGIAGGDMETLLVKSGDGPVMRFEVGAERLARALSAALGGGGETTSLM